MAKRLPPQLDEWIDRDVTLGFNFEDHAYRAYAGDVVSSALMAADQMHLGRSFKYHRPRGTLSFANHDANVLLQSADRTNIRGDVEPVAEGANYKAVNTIGGLRFDATRVLQLFSRGGGASQTPNPGWRCICETSNSSRCRSSSLITSKGRWRESRTSQRFMSKLRGP